MARALARRSPDAPDWQRNREVQRLTREILALQSEVSGKVVAAIVAMGTRMRQIRAALERGAWMSWLETAVPFDLRTVQRAMRLSEWAEAEPRELARLEHLGPTKLYMLAPLPPERRRELTRRTVPLVIPGRVVPKTVELMTVVELGEVIGGLVARPTPPKPIGKLVQGARHRIAGLDAVADEAGAPQGGDRRRAGERAGGGAAGRARGAGGGVRAVGGATNTPPGMSA